MPADLTIYNRIKNLADSQNLSLRQLSLKAGFKSPSAISRYKQGVKPTDTALKAISNVLNVSVDYLLGNTDEKTPQSTNTEESQEIDLDVLTDTDNIKKRLISFGGKPVTEHDAKVISQFLKTYYEGRD